MLCLSQALPVLTRQRTRSHMFSHDHCHQLRKTSKGGRKFSSFLPSGSPCGPVEHPLPEGLDWVTGQGSRLSGVSLACLCNFHSEAELHACLCFRPVALDMRYAHIMVTLNGEAPTQLLMPPCASIPVDNLFSSVVLLSVHKQ